MSQTRFIAFYSYKGGVGRSLALANTAYELARQGNKVLILDLDLEAPGQHMTDLFRPRVSHPRDLKGWPGAGLLELFEYWQACQRDNIPFEFDLAKYLKLPREEVRKTLAKTEQSGSISLLPAGDESDEKYSAHIADFSWDVFYQSGGQALLTHVQHRCHAEGYDYVLMDARTGLSEEFYVSALELADTVVVVAGLNWQNIEGARKVVERLRSEPAKQRFGDKRVLLVGSPVPTLLGAELLARRRADIRMQWPGFTDFHVSLPYDSELALEERVFSWERDDRGLVSPYAEGIVKLVEILNEPEEAIGEILEAPKPGNPFALVRRDYIKDEDVARFFVDPGGNIIEDMANFTPLVVSGARGSGKTMLASKFSLVVNLAEQRRASGGNIDVERIRQVGLYFRIDADFLDSFNQRDDSLRKTFDRLFSLFFDIVVIRKALLALDSLGGIGNWCDEKRLFTALFSEFAEVSPAELSHAAFGDFLERQLTQIRIYLNNPTRVDPPLLLSANSLMKQLMEELSRAGKFGERYFVILIDEYENYADYQQRMINTRLKQSRREDGVTYRLFMRSGGLTTRETLAPGQTIEEIHDYRRHSLDEDLEFIEFSRHAIAVANRHLEEEPWFRANGYVRVEALFEDLSSEDEARLLVEGGKRQDQLSQWLQQHGGEAARPLLDWMATEISPLRRAVAVVLFNQGKDAAEIASAFQQDNQKSRDWYHNYHRGALHWLCRLYRTDKKYSGLNQILGLAGNNIRVFLDFCHGIVAEWLAFPQQSLPIPWLVQDVAIHRQSRILRENLYSASRSTAEVNQLLERLGRLFELTHKSPRQSEPEINHFAIKGEAGNADSCAKLDKWLRDAWYEGILRQFHGNKQKSLHEARGVDWQIAPWLAPLFNLSTRRKKKAMLRAEEVLVLFQGGEADWQKMFKAKERELDQSGASDNGQEQLW